MIVIRSNIVGST